MRADGYMAEASSPVVVKQKAREARKGGLRTAFVLSMKASVIILVLTVTTFGFLILRSSLLHSPRFNIAIKEVHGLHYVPESHVLMKIRDLEERSMNLLSWDLNQLRESIELQPWIKEAVVRRVFPDKLVIEIKERVPIAYSTVENGTCLVDDDGMLLENRPEALSDFDFPVVVGLEQGFDKETLKRNRKRISLYQSLIQSLNQGGAALSQDLSEVYLQDPDNISVILNGDTVVVHLGSDRFPEKFRRYLAMSQELKKKYSLLDSVDLRYRNQVVINTANQRIAEEAQD